MRTLTDDELLKMSGGDISTSDVLWLIVDVALAASGAGWATIPALFVIKEGVEYACENWIEY